jgi:hypothetical protein
VTERVDIGGDRVVGLHCYTPEGEGRLQGNWQWKAGERTGHAGSRDSALFWAGWWLGRRQIADAVEELAQFGEGPEDG